MVSRDEPSPALFGQGPLSTDPDAIDVRLTPVPAMAIWPGLDFIVRANRSRIRFGTSGTSFRSVRIPPPANLKLGSFAQDLMDHAVSLWQKLQPIAKTGGIIEMDPIDVRIALLSARLTLKLTRAGYRNGRWGSEKRSRAVVQAEVATIRSRTRSVVRFLEKVMKQADRRFVSVQSRRKLAIRKVRWKAHLQWMKVNLLWFKPLPSPRLGSKRFHQMIIRLLVRMAEEGIRRAGYELPDAAELRRVIRLYGLSARRGRQPVFDLPYMTSNLTNPAAQKHLMQFIRKRIELKKARRT